MFCLFFLPADFQSQERLASLLTGTCKCKEGSCYKELSLDEVQHFMDQFEKHTKREQDCILYLAADLGTPGRREFHFLGHYMKRVCWESLLGLSSHRVDRIGALDMRYGAHSRASKLTASVDAFCMVLYNSLAEPLPNKFLTLHLVTLRLEFDQIVFQCVSFAADILNLGLCGLALQRPGP